MWIFRLFRNTVFVGALVVSLATSTIALGAWALSLTTQVATMTASAAAAAIANRKAIAGAVARTKAKARLRRFVAVLPFAGVAAVTVFERQDYLEWKEDNPDGDFTEYSCQSARLSAEVIDDVLAELPETMRPSRDFLLAQLPTCENGEKG